MSDVTLYFRTELHKVGAMDYPILGPSINPLVVRQKKRVAIASHTSRLPAKLT